MCMHLLFSAIASNRLVYQKQLDGKFLKALNEISLKTQQESQRSLFFHIQYLCRLRMSCQGARQVVFSAAPLSCANDQCNVSTDRRSGLEKTVR